MHLLEVLQLPVRHEDDDSLPATIQIDLLGGGEDQTVQLSLELGGVGLQERSAAFTTAERRTSLPQGWQTPEQQRARIHQAERRLLSQFWKPCCLNRAGQKIDQEN